MSRHWHPRENGRVVPLGRRPAARRLRSSPRWIEAVTLGGLLLGALFAFRMTATGIPASPGTAEPGSPASVHVIDGDTFDHGGVRIRIADIDTPELRGQCAYERRLAARATTRMRGLLGEGPFELRRTGTRDTDRYGRKLRIVTRGGRSLGDMLVAEGLARTWSGRRERWCG